MEIQNLVLDYDDENMAWAWQTLEDFGFIISSNSLIEDCAGIVLGAYCQKVEISDNILPLILTEYFTILMKDSDLSFLAKKVMKDI